MLIVAGVRGIFRYVDQDHFRCLKVLQVSDQPLREDNLLERGASTPTILRIESQQYPLDDAAVRLRNVLTIDGISLVTHSQPEIGWKIFRSPFFYSLASRPLASTNGGKRNQYLFPGRAKCADGLRVHRAALNGQGNRTDAANFREHEAYFGLEQRGGLGMDWSTAIVYRLNGTPSCALRCTNSVESSRLRTHHVERARVRF